MRNNSSGTVSSLALSRSGIFGFEGDGICAFTFVGSGYCSGSYYRSDPGDYAGPSSTFTVTNANSGTVNFSPGIGPGGTSYFSLEGVPTSSLAPIPTVGPSTGVSAPALSTWGMLLLTVLLMGLSIRLLKRA